MNEFRFAHPGCIHLLWGVLAVAGLLVFFELRGRSLLERFVSPILQPRLVRRTSLLRRLATLALVCLAMLVLVFALMRPQWGTTIQRAVRVDAQIMICLDVSKSMLAEDVAPNRLERAKIELDSLLGLMNDGQQVGLIAFAGRAAVLCPMTTDFGFLRLILNEVEPASVGLGGTQIGDAIRKAVDGFRDSGDIHRLVLLVTDGEDHDSFPLEAAKAAREKGVKIVSIGFGDEAGSKIEVTDPQTGARTFVKDRNGQDVDSRLEGVTLREIALQTDGAYVPAGTGALDLESIYRTYIATLLQGSTDSQTHVVRHEAYQWLVLVALLLWLMGLILATPWYLRTQNLRTQTLGAAAPAASAARAAALLAGLTIGAAASPVLAQAPAAAPAAESPARSKTEAVERTATPAADDEADSADQADAGVATEAASDAAEDALPPRAAYNRALACLTSDPAQAETYLNAARRDAGSDGELRYRALYNLGWVEVTRANSLLGEQPSQALQHLQQAANRFREAVRVRPDSADARHNLEIVSQRILELADSLAKKDPRDLASRLDALIQQLRAHQSELQAVVQQSGAEVPQAAAEAFRQDYRRLGATQRQVIAELQLFADDARKELDALNQKPDDQKSPEDRLRTGQYGNMLRFLDSSLQRLSQSRSLTRRLQGDRAFRRWAAGLSEAKRARDQLRDPVELLSQILDDAIELSRLTDTLHTTRTALETDASPSAAPVWLTREYLQDLQTATLDRTREVHQSLAAAVPEQETFGPQPTPPAAPDAPTPTPDPRTQQLLANIPHALPLIDQAIQAFERSSAGLAAGSLDQAVRDQTQAIAALYQAWEWFFDIRRLIEVMYHDQRTLVQPGVHSAQPDPALLRAIAASAFPAGSEAGADAGAARSASAQLAAALIRIQQRNRDRAARLDKMFDLEIDQLKTKPAAPPPPAAAPGTAPGTAAQPAPDQTQQLQLQRFEMAKQLLGQVLSDLDRSFVPLETLAAEPASPESPPAPAEAPGSPVPGDRSEAADPQPPATAAPPATEAPATEAPATEAPATEAPATDAPALDAPAPVDPAATAAASPPRDPRWTETEAAVDGAVASLEDLRRLFFSLVEHLRDTAQRQADLNDDTVKQSTEPAESQTPEKLGPLASRQSQLQQVAQGIAEALREQSTQSGAANAAAQPAAGPPAGPDPAEAAAAAQQLGDAAQLVETAHSAMAAAAQKLNTQVAAFDAAAKPFADITGQQHTALEKLIEALALLDQSQPPPPEQGDENQDQQQQESQQQSEDQQQQQNMSANQLLQLIRDREAQRREDKKQQSRMPPSSVEKDW